MVQGCDESAWKLDHEMAGALSGVSPEHGHLEPGEIGHVVPLHVARGNQGRGSATLGVRLRRECHGCQSHCKDWCDSLVHRMPSLGCWFRPRTYIVLQANAANRARRLASSGAQRVCPRTAACSHNPLRYSPSGKWIKTG